MTRGGQRPGAGRPRKAPAPRPPRQMGRPRGDKLSTSYGIRVTPDTVARAAARGETIGQRVDRALNMLDSSED